MSSEFVVVSIAFTVGGWWDQKQLPGLFDLCVHKGVCIHIYLSDNEKQALLMSLAIKPTHKALTNIIIDHGVHSLIIASTQ